MGGVQIRRIETLYSEGNFDKLRINGRADIFKKSEIFECCIPSFIEVDVFENEQVKGVCGHVL